MCTDVVAASRDVMLLYSHNHADLEPQAAASLTLMSTLLFVHFNIIQQVNHMLTVKQQLLVGALL
jgi:hypothetical protein